MVMTGVYCITNTVNRKVYVGSAARSLGNRVRSHKYRLSRNLHNNEHLQNAWNKYGKHKFRFSVLEECSPKECLDREQRWIDKYKASDRRFGYNKSPTAGSPLGVKHTELARKSMSEASKGKKKSREHVLAIRVAKQNMSQETKDKMSKSQSNRSQIHKDRISAAMMGNTRCKGRVASEESRIRWSKLAKERWKRWKKTGRDKEIGKSISESKKKKGAQDGRDLFI